MQCGCSVTVESQHPFRTFSLAESVHLTVNYHSFKVFWSSTLQTPAGFLFVTITAAQKPTDGMSLIPLLEHILYVKEPGFTTDLLIRFDVDALASAAILFSQME